MKLHQIRKYNIRTREYEKVNVPADYKLLLYSENMDEPCNCANCGATILYGDAYTSRIYHNEHGFGYSVCEECHEEEFRDEMRWRKEQ